jgi:hypothetical protein
MSELLVSMEGIDRSFPGVRALDRCPVGIDAPAMKPLLHD